MADEVATVLSPDHVPGLDRVGDAARARRFRLDVLTIIGLAIAAAIYGNCIYLITDGVPFGGSSYFGADTRRVLENLVNPNSDYFRVKVHPLFGLACAIAQLIQRTFDLSPMELVQLIAVLQASSVAIVVYVTSRLLSLKPVDAALASLLAMSMAGVVFWIAIPETHLLGGVTVLTAFALLQISPKTAQGNLTLSTVAFTASFSPVVTNAAAWGICWMRRIASIAPGRSPPGENLYSAIAQFVITGLAGLGLTLLLYTVGLALLRNESVGHLLNFVEEARYIKVDGFRDALGGLNVIGGFAADGYRSTPLERVGNALLLGATFLLALSSRDSAVKNALLFLLFGVALHSLYARHEAFLFAPNFAPLAAVVLAVTTLRRWPLTGRWFLVIGLITLQIINLSTYTGKILELESKNQIAPVQSKSVHR